MSARGRRLAPWGVAALACLLTACSSGSKSGSKSTPPAGQQHSGVAGTTATSSSAAANGTTQASGPADACTLVTPAEAQAALGKPVRPAKAKAVGPAGQQGASCTYESTDFANGTSAGLALVFTVFSHSSMSQSQFDVVYSGNGSKAVPGLGDSAWFRGGMLNVYDNGANLSVAIVSLSTEATVNQLTPVARLALQRI